MPIICPTITAFDPHEYREQMERVMEFSERIHIDLMDGEFAPTRSPLLEQVWWPHHITADIHLMYKHPMDYLEQLIRLNPHMVVIHFEAEVDHMHFASLLHKENIKTGLAFLHDTPARALQQAMHSFDQILIFSGNLGYHGGKMDASLLNKVAEIQDLHPDAEIAWDGGINDQNIKSLIDSGVDVLNVGAFVQKAEDPLIAYAKLKQQI